MQFEDTLAAVVPWRYGPHLLCGTLGKLTRQ